jgi:hypothetical protein
MDNCESVKFQFWTGMVHFFWAFLIPAKMSFKRKDEFQEAGFIGEGSFGFCEFAELAVDGLDSVGSVDNAADVVVVAEIGG